MTRPVVSRSAVAQLTVLAACIVLGRGALAWSDQSTGLRVLPIEIDRRPDGHFVSASGQWQRDSQGISVIMRVNAVTLHCDRLTMKCHESIAMVTTPADGLPTSGALFALLFEYDVTKWADVIEASGKTRVSDLNLMIDLEKKVVSRTMAETTERGAKLSNPSTERWVLR